jgi:hypothetical protein
MYANSWNWGIPLASQNLNLPFTVDITSTLTAHSVVLIFFSTHTLLKHPSSSLISICSNDDRKPAAGQNQFSGNPRLGISQNSFLQRLEIKGSLV